MKIDKLYTLSQFVDYTHELRHDVDDLILFAWRYNDFLKQPLKKEMFVNELKEPIGYIGFGSEKAKDKVAWKKAEKKVIFDCKKYILSCETIEYDCGRVKIYGYDSTDDLLIVPNGGSGKWVGNMSTLSCLAEATNGELKLKNVEI